MSNPNELSLTAQAPDVIPGGVVNSADFLVEASDDVAESIAQERDAPNTPAGQYPDAGIPVPDAPAEAPARSTQAEPAVGPSDRATLDAINPLSSLIPERSNDVASGQPKNNADAGADPESDEIPEVATDVDDGPPSTTTPAQAPETFSPTTGRDAAPIDAVARHTALASVFDEPQETRDETGPTDAGDSPESVSAATDHPIEEGDSPDIERQLSGSSGVPGPPDTPSGGGPGNPGSPEDSDDDEEHRLETARQLLVQQCKAETIGGIYLIHALSGGASETPADDARAALAEVTQDVQAADTISDPPFRTITRAGIAQSTGDAELRAAAIREVTGLYRSSGEDRLVAALAEKLRDSAVLDIITDFPIQQHYAYQLAIRVPTPDTIAYVRDPGNRRTILERLMRTGEDEDVYQWIDAMEAEGMGILVQDLIRSRALSMLDTGVTERLTDPETRINTLLEIARLSGGEEVSPRILALVEALDDTRAAMKAYYYRDYLLYRPDDQEAIAALERAAQAIDDPIMQSVFLADVISKTKDASLAPSIESTLELYEAGVNSHNRDQMLAGLARGMSDFSYTETIANPQLKREVQGRVIIDTVDRTRAWELGDPAILGEFAETHNDGPMAARMANDTTDILRERGFEALIKVAVATRDIGLIRQVNDANRRNQLFVDYLVQFDEAHGSYEQTMQEVAKVQNNSIRQSALIRIALQRLDVELAEQAHADTNITDYIRGKVLAQRIPPLEEIADNPDPQSREILYYLHPVKDDPTVRSRIASNILEGWERGRRYDRFLQLAARANDVSYVYAALDDLRGSIITQHAVWSTIAALDMLNHPDAVAATLEKHTAAINTYTPERD